MHKDISLAENMSVISFLIQVMPHFQSMRAACNKLWYSLFPDMWWMTAEQAQ